MKKGQYLSIIYPILILSFIHKKRELLIRNSLCSSPNETILERNILRFQETLQPKTSIRRGWLIPYS